MRTTLDHLSEGAGAMPLELWTIYRSPADHPGRFVLRRFVVGAGGEDGPIPDAVPTTITDSLEACRAAVPPGLYRIPRNPCDPPSVLETWL